MNNIKISIIIASRNAREDLKKCLSSIYDNCRKEAIEVIVSDNNSNDGSIEMLAKYFQQVKVCSSKHDISYPLTINRGIEASIGQYLLFLDSDVIIKKDTVPELAHFLDVHPEVGVAVSKMFYPDGTVQLMARRFPGPLNSLFGRQSLLTRLLPHNKISKRYLMVDELKKSEPFEVDWASLASMMIRRKVFDKVGLMDEGFLMYWMDADLCRRIRNDAWRIFCLPKAAVIHDMRNDPDKKKSYFMIKAFHQGVYRYFKKYYTKSSLHPLNLVVFVCLCTRAALQLFLNMMKS